MPNLSATERTRIPEIAESPSRQTSLASSSLGLLLNERFMRRSSLLSLDSAPQPTFRRLTKEKSDRDQD
jgi:hypothetical protein